MWDLTRLVKTSSTPLEIKLRLETGMQLFRLSLGRNVFFRTGFTRAHFKSSGNKPEHSDASMMSVQCNNSNNVLSFPGNQDVAASTLQINSKNVKNAATLGK